MVSLLLGTLHNNLEKYNSIETLICINNKNKIILVHLYSSFFIELVRFKCAAQSLATKEQYLKVHVLYSVHLKVFGGKQEVLETRSHILL